MHEIKRNESGDTVCLHERKLLATSGLFNALGIYNDKPSRLGSRRDPPKVSKGFVNVNLYHKGRCGNRGIWAVGPMQQKALLVNGDVVDFPLCELVVRWVSNQCRT